MNTNTIPTCATCAYYREGQCRRKSPLITEPHWPTIGADQWCGCFKGKPEPKAEPVIPPPQPLRIIGQSITFADIRCLFPGKSEPALNCFDLWMRTRGARITGIGTAKQMYNLLQRYVEDGCIECVDIVGGRGYRSVV